VFAETGTITGSIGVIGGKVNLEGLYRKVGIAKDAVERGARAGMLSETRSFTPDEKRALRGEMKAVYDNFVARVAQGRKLTVEETHAVGQGRVWSGRRAQEIGLVDAIGGPLEAIGAIRRRAGLRDGTGFFVDRYPRRPRIPGVVDLLRLLPLR
jgi:protease-4